MSVLGKQWKILNESEKSILEKLLENRGFSNIDELTEIDAQDLHDPFLFSDMQKAIDRINQSVENGERIIVFGDYDVDGISAAAIVFQVLKKIGAQVSYRIPHRVNDGYGLTEKFIEDFQNNDVKLLITVDCGISCAKVISKCKDVGIDTIITDHHAIPNDFPNDALAVIHPKYDQNYPFDELTGSGVALKLAHAIILRHLPENEQKEMLEDLIDLSSLGTVADLGPLVGENRTIVRRGITKLKNTRWIGLDLLMKLARIEKKEISASTIGFGIAPRINAAGRIDDPYIPLTLLLQEQISEKAEILAQKLEQINHKRRELTIQACDELASHFTEDNLPKILIAESIDWHVGILGLIAGKISEKTMRPAIIFQDFGEYLVGSARSQSCFDITQALKFCHDLIDTYGGHKQAAGLTISKKNYQQFKDKISEYAEQNIQDDDLHSIMALDCELQQDDLCFELSESIKQMSPFGIGNSHPKFVIRNIEPLFVKQIGRDSAHLKFAIQAANNTTLNVIAFNMGEHAQALKETKNIHLAFELKERFWQGEKRLELQALDFEICQA